MYLGEYQLGDLLPVTVWTRNGTLPTQPDDPPVAVIWSTTGIVEAVSIPVEDPVDITGRFRYLVNLDAKYAEGYYVILTTYAISGTVVVEEDSFGVLGGGNGFGTGIAMEYFKAGVPAYVLHHSDTGLLLRKKNPTITV